MEAQETLLMTLDEMKPGNKAVITGYREGPRNYRAKLLSMGLTRGTVIELLKVAPLGDPIEIKIRGFNLSLRKSEASILVLAKQHG
ncbi:MAG: ferrous iron transport protein A [Spirochaetales bacterium]|nr:ferrous iron transport protein A [Spirochaetales bacterium]